MKIQINFKYTLKNKQIKQSGQKITKKLTKGFLKMLHCMWTWTGTTYHATHEPHLARPPSPYRKKSTEKSYKEKLTKHILMSVCTKTEKLW